MLHDDLTLGQHVLVEGDLEELRGRRTAGDAHAVWLTCGKSEGQSVRGKAESSVGNMEESVPGAKKRRSLVEACSTEEGRVTSPSPRIIIQLDQRVSKSEPQGATNAKGV